MNLARSGRNHRGIIGVESAIVMISFVIVAAALAFVVLNMGFSTTQQAKTTISSSLSEAGSSLIVSGKVVGSGHIVDSSLNATAIPIKIAAGGDSVNLDPALTSVKYLSTAIAFDDILSDTELAAGFTVQTSLQNAVGRATTDGIISQDPYAQAGWPANTAAFFYWTKDNNGNNILDSGEHAVLAIVWAQNDRPSYLDTFRAEIIGPAGATLTAERDVPIITNTVVDLG